MDINNLNQQNYDNINNIRFDLINIIEILKKLKIDLTPDIINFKEKYIDSLQRENNDLLSKIKEILTDTTQKCLDSEECLQNKKKYYQICEELKRYGQKYEKLPRDEYINQGYEVLYDKTIQKVSASTPSQDRNVEDELCDETIGSPSKKKIEEGKASTWRKNVGAYCDPKFPGRDDVTTNFKKLISGDNLETLQTELLNYYTDKERSPIDKHIPGNNLSEIWKHIKKNCQNECEGKERQILENKFNVIREKVKSEARPILENKLKEKREMIIKKNTNCNYQKCINDYNRIRSLLRELDDEDDKCLDEKDKELSEMLAQNLDNSLELKDEENQKKNAEDICKLHYMKDKGSCHPLRFDSLKAFSDVFKSTYEVVKCKGAGGKKSIKKKRKIINNKLNKKSKKKNKLNKKYKKTVSKKK
jgi:hypothetical protein